MAVSWLTKIGDVSWENISEDLLKLSKEQLVEMINVGLKNFWTQNNYWNVLTERNFDVDTATRLDNEVWQYTAKTQAYRIKKALNLGNDLQSLAVVLKLSSLQWINSGFCWEFTAVTGQRLEIGIHSCPMGTYRTKLMIPLYPCKIITPILYRSMAEVINPKIIVSCLHAYPDQPRENTMCIWEFTLQEE